MSTDQILSLVQVDHDPVPVAIAVSLGWTPEEYNAPSNLTLRLIKDHREKTAKRDVPAIYKSDRIAEDHAAFQNRILAKSDQSHTQSVKKSVTDAVTKIKSRPFQKAPEGHQWFQKGRRMGRKAISK